MRTRILALAALAATGCITGNPHSMVYGRTAAPLGAGRAEVAVSPGLMFEDLSQANQNTRGSSSQTTTAVTFPTAEGNLDYGLGDFVDVGAHLSLVGLQPDLKIAVVRGPINFAIAPEMAFGLAHASSAAQVGGSSNQSLNALTFMAGIKLLVSHESGAYAGLGYDFEHTGLSTSDGSGSAFGSSGEDFNAHNISAAFGYSTHGRVILRPELSFVFCPSQGVSQTSGSFSQAQPNSNSFFVIMPSLTVALRTDGEPERAHEGRHAEDVRSAPPPQAP